MPIGMPFKWPVKRRPKGNNQDETSREGEHNEQVDNKQIQPTEIFSDSPAKEEPSQNLERVGLNAHRHSSRKERLYNSGTVSKDRPLSTPNSRSNGIDDEGREEADEENEEAADADNMAGPFRLFCTETNVNLSPRPTTDELFCVESPSSDGATRRRSSVRSSQPSISTAQHIRRQIRLNVAHFAEATATPVRKLHRQTTRNRVHSSPGSLQYPRQSPLPVTDGEVTFVTTHSDVANMMTSSSENQVPVVMNDLIVTDLDDV